MADVVSPLADPTTWTYDTVSVTVPAGLRYERYRVRALRATRGAPADVRVPAESLVRRVDEPGGRTVIELQVNPFPLRAMVAALPWGVPTFYVVFPDPTGVTLANDRLAPAGDVIRAAVDVSILMIGQDRVTRDPALWARQIREALATSGGDVSGWQPFLDAVEAAVNSGPSAAVLLLDHAGEPLSTGTVDVLIGQGAPTATHRVVLAPEDEGNLQQALARLHAADPVGMPLPNLWSTGTSARIRPLRAADEQVQIVTLEDPLGRQVDEIVVTPSARHVQLTNLHRWFAPQFAEPLDDNAPRLARYTHGNLVRPLINGPEFFDDFFRAMDQARFAGGGVHLAGWAMFPTTEFTERRTGDPDDLPLTLEDAAKRIGEDGGASRFLPAQFIQLPPESSVTDQEILAFQFLASTILIANSFGVSAVRTDSAGVVIMLGLMFGNALLAHMMFEKGGRFLEPNKDAVEVLNTPTNARCVFSPYPATVADNSAVPQPVTGFPFDTLFQVVRHFGIYHQKFAVVRTNTGDVGYCGGIDVNPNRLDTAEHLARGPYHDVHARVDGQAVRDLAISFAERWQHDGGGTLAFNLPPVDDELKPGTDIVQVARTYAAIADTTRQLPFAPNGDRTIADDMLNGLREAREFIYIEDQYFNPPAEYNAALVAAVSRVKQMIIAIPSLPDQPLGDVVRSQLITDLRAADQAAGGGIVQIGYPRRRYTVPDNDLRTSSGKCTLAEALPAMPGLDPTIVLSPSSRVPAPPFWVAVGGELMWVFDESPTPAPTGTKRMRVERGDRTRLFRDATGLRGPRTRAHAAGAAATVVALSGIYVHTKMMIVDDVFLGIGSANLNRRGLFHDGEINIFTMPERLRAAADNPIAALRRRLWAEMLDLPEAMASPILADPIAAGRLFGRSPLTGNRYVDTRAFPATLFLDATTGDSLISTLLRGFVFGVAAVDHERLFDTVLDPSTSTEQA